MKLISGLETPFHYLIKRATVFLFISAMITLSFYIIGNIQNFLDSTQLFLLGLARLFGTLSIIASVVGIAGSVERMIHERSVRRLPSAFKYLLVAAGAVLISAFAAFITSWTRP